MSSMPTVYVSGLRGGVDVVTGGSRGIGRAITDALQRQGAQAAVLDREAPGGLPGQDDGRLFVPCDVTQEDAVDEALTTVETLLGSPSLLVDNAGVLQLATSPPRSWTSTACSSSTDWSNTDAPRRRL